MDANNPRYADGSVVHVGDTVEFNKASALQSLAGYVDNMDSLIGVRLLVKEIISTRIYRGSDVANLRLEALDDQSVQGTLNFWNYSSDMFVPSSECDVDMVDSAGLTEFLERV